MKKVAGLILNRLIWVLGIIAMLYVVQFALVMYWMATGVPVAEHPQLIALPGFYR